MPQLVAKYSYSFLLFIMFVVCRPLRGLVDHMRVLANALRVLLREIPVELLREGLCVQRSPFLVSRFVCPLA